MMEKIPPRPVSVPSTEQASRDQELWGVALWVEKHHGENGWFYIAQQKDRLLAAGEPANPGRNPSVAKPITAQSSRSPGATPSGFASFSSTVIVGFLRPRSMSLT